MAALLYFDETQNVNVKPGLIFFVQCSIASEQIFTIQSVKMWAQANEQVSHLHFVFRQSRATLQIYLSYITIYNHFYLTGVSIGTFQNIDSIGVSLKTLPMYYK